LTILLFAGAFQLRQDLWKLFVPSCFRCYPSVHQVPFNRWQMNINAPFPCLRFLNLCQKSYRHLSVEL